MCSILRVHSKHSLCLSICKFIVLICSVHKDPIHQKVASIRANICAVYLKYIVTIHLVCTYKYLLTLYVSGMYHELTLYVQYTKNLAFKKWLPFERICEVYLEYIVTIHFVRPYPNLLTLYVQYTKTLAVKKWLPFELICAVYIVSLNSSPCSNLVQI